MNKQPQNLVSTFQRFNVSMLVRSGVSMLFLLLLSCATPPPPSAPLPANIAPESQSLSVGSGIPAVGEMAPDFSYTMSNGNTVRLSDLGGKVVIINFWATWCGPCRQEMPDLQQAENSSNGQVIVIGVNKLEEVSAIAPFGQTVGVTFTLVANPVGDIAERYGVRNLPTSFFVRPDGTIGDWRLGAMDANMIKESIETSR